MQRESEGKWVSPEDKRMNTDAAHCDSYENGSVQMRDTWQLAERTNQIFNLMFLNVHQLENVASIATRRETQGRSSF